jgi:predicted 2-oxoglutarate/Fe(II)-dependent dioxygenase YbiX
VRTRTTSRKPSARPDVVRQYRELEVGDPGPPFRQRSITNPAYAFDTAAGRYLVLCFFGSMGDEAGARAVNAALTASELFDDTFASFFGVASEPEDEGRLKDANPGRRFFFDFDHRVARLYGAAPRDGDPPWVLRRRWVVLDPTMRVLRVIPFSNGDPELGQLFGYLRSLPPPGRAWGIEVQAPILYLPNVFSPDLCESLIERYRQGGGRDSGFMREVNGKTVLINDTNHKVRKDFDLPLDDPLRTPIQRAIQRRIASEIMRVHFFNPTRMERYIVGCYTAEDGGHFRAHRDNTTPGTAHRRYAVSINLNDAFEGGELNFPEYGPRSYKPPPGGAVVFSCALLHRVSRVTRGERYAFLPFLYDDAAAVIRERNASTLEIEARNYRANPAQQRG